jgi:GTP-binding protein HflX
VASHFKGHYHHLKVRLPHTAGKLRAQLYDLGQVLAESFDEQGRPILEIRLTDQQKKALDQLPEAEIIASLG